MYHRAASFTAVIGFAVLLGCVQVDAESVDSIVPQEAPVASALVEELPPVGNTDIKDIKAPKEEFIEDAAKSKSKAATGFWRRRRRTTTLKAPKGQVGFMNMAHMVNTKETLDWGLAQGANTVEIDIVYDSVSSEATQARHSMAADEPCDCTCYVPSMLFLNWKANVCSSLMAHGGKGSGTFACQAARPIQTYMTWLAARKQIAMTYLDNKVHPGWTQAQQKKAGTSIAKLVEYLFKKGYAGSVIVGGSDAKFKTYLVTALKYLKANLSADVFKRTYWTYDFHGADKIISVPLSGESKAVNAGIVKENIEHMHRDFKDLTDNYVYSVGISACAPTTHYDMAEYAMAYKHHGHGVHGGNLKAVLVWTIDSESSMRKYIDIGVDGMMTNYPSYLKIEAVDKNKKFMQPAL
jgi:hypothetical protein